MCSKPCKYLSNVQSESSFVKYIQQLQRASPCIEFLGAEADIDVVDVDFFKNMSLWFLLELLVSLWCFCGFACKLTLRQQTCHELSFNKKNKLGGNTMNVDKSSRLAKIPSQVPYSELSLCDSTASANFCPTWANHLGSWATQRGLHNILYSYIPRFVGIIITLL